MHCEKKFQKRQFLTQELDRNTVSREEGSYAIHEKNSFQAYNCIAIVAHNRSRNSRLRKRIHVLLSLL
jgi:hypothetical protein